MRDYKIIVLGSGRVGKSSLTIQYEQGIFVENYDHTIEDRSRKVIEVENTRTVLDISDMPTDLAGTIHSATLRDLQIRNGQGFLIVYSVTSEKSFEDVLNIREQIVRVKGTDRVPMVLVGNKADLEHERQVPTSEGMILANRWGVPFYESSAKNTQNVNEIFTDCVVEIMHSSSPPKRTAGKCCRQCYVL